MKYFTKFMGKQLYRSFFLQLQTERDSSTDVFRWIIRKFSICHFHGTPTVNCLYIKKNGVSVVPSCFLKASFTHFIVLLRILYLIFKETMEAHWKYSAAVANKNWCLVYFMISRFQGYRKMTSCTKSEVFYKVCVHGEGCKLIAMRTHMDYLFPTGNKNAL